MCTENKFSLTQRFRLETKLRRLARNDKIKKQVQYFNKFIKQFPECNTDPESLFEEIMETGQKIRLKN